MDIENGGRRPSLTHGHREWRKETVIDTWTDIENRPYVGAEDVLKYCIAAAW